MEILFILAPLISMLLFTILANDRCKYQKGKYCMKFGNCNKTCTTIGKRDCPLGRD